MAAFQVFLYGRFWVFTEDVTDFLCKVSRIFQVLDNAHVFLPQSEYYAFARPADTLVFLLFIRRVVI
jgi:hypothetical protein